MNKKHVQAWREGKTGYPLVDANMRELAATGFMSNRGRQNVASFLALDMKTEADPAWISQLQQQAYQSHFQHGHQAAVKAAQDQGVKLPRVALILELEEESGSPNLIKLLKLASDSIGTPDIMFCMDSGAFDYSKLWITSSLRGICILDMKVECGTAGYHSGEVGGIVPETFRVLRTLLDRLDDKETGEPCNEL